MPRPKDKIDEKKLSCWKLLDDFRARLAKAQAAAPEIEKRPGGPERKLLEADHFSLFLFGTLLPALPRMHWALWLNDKNRAAKLHLKFSVLRQAPGDALITAGSSCERKALRQGMVKLGDKWQGEPMRVVKVAVDGKELLLAADLEIEAELIALIYRYRWQIELFFKYMKTNHG